MEKILKNIVVLLSGNGSNLQAIIDAIRNGQIAAKICCVISNNATSFGLKRAERAAIATAVVEHQHFTSRAAFDQQLQTLIDGYAPDVVVLAGFMRILSAEFVHHYQGRLLNIHPSLLPKYRGLHTYQRALAAKETEHGTSVHFVTENLDDGPIILQARVPILADDSVEKLALKTQQWEYKIYPKVLEWFTAERLTLRGNAAYLDGRKLPVNGLTIANEETEPLLVLK